LEALRLSIIIDIVSITDIFLLCDTIDTKEYFLFKSPSYAAGDASVIVPAQLIIAAAEGSRASIGVNMGLTQQEFLI
jgi:hypothetical protein